MLTKGENEQVNKQPCQAQVLSSGRPWIQPSMKQLAQTPVATWNARLSSSSSVQGSGQDLALYLEAMIGTTENNHCQSKTHSPDISLGTVFRKIAQPFSAIRNPTGMTSLYMFPMHLSKQNSYHRRMNPFTQLEQSRK